MPGGDKTGPMGAGPGTGRRAGFCYGNNQPGYMTRGGRGGWGGGFGRGRRNFGWPAQGYGAGWGRGYGFGFRAAEFPQASMATDSLQDEMIRLAEQTQRCADAIDDIRKRLDTMRDAKE